MCISEVFKVTLVINVTSFVKKKYIVKIAYKLGFSKNKALWETKQK